MVKNQKTKAVIKTSSCVGEDIPEETIEYMSSKFITNDGPLAETGVLVGLSAPMPAPAGQKMGPWIKADVTVTVPCDASEASIKEASAWCQKFAEQRLQEIVKSKL